jgi:Gluconate 2-dehydrogenase subunit 3
MGGQGIERRVILRYIGLASVASTFPGFRRWAFACSHAAPAAGGALAAEAAYTPLFFSPAEFKLVERLAEMIIPADDTPGAKEAGVAEFIDFMVANRVPVNASEEMNRNLALGAAVQVQFRTGLGWLDAHSTTEFGHGFLGCSEQQQLRVLQEIAYKDKYTPITEAGRDFFQLIRDYTVVGYYTTRIGLESLGYPGLQPVWPAMPGCTHPDDPEHAHLQEPGSASPAAPAVVKG